MAIDLVAVTTILHELFEHEPDQWARRLDELCAAHPGLAPELRRRFDLLRATGLDRTEDIDAAAPEPALPDRLGDFRLLRRLGSGGMGLVFAAEQVSLGREVALKVVRPEFLFAAAARERFRREIDAIARLEHPAIVPVLTHGEEAGVPFYVMPLVRGRPADEVVRRLEGRDAHRLTGADLQRAIAGDEGDANDGSAGAATFAGAWWEACVRLVRQVALGLQHAHSRGIVHRDVKPSNLLLTPDGRALLFDFGLAHVRDDARITRTGTAPGSPAYMSPEQLLGRASDERTDVYSLAATLHHIVSLTCPFPIQDSEVLRARILAGQPEPLDRGTMPPELHVVLRAAMDVDREQRHATAQAFADDLLAVLERRPVRARPLPFALRARRWCGRHRPATVAIAALLVGAAVLPGSLWLQQRAANVELRRETERAERNLMRSLVVVDELLLRAGDRSLRNVPAAQQVAGDLMQRAVDHFDSIAAEEPGSDVFRPQHITAIRQLASMRLHLGDAAGAEALAERALRMLLEDGGQGTAEHLRRAHAGTVLAACRERLGKLQEALRDLDAVERELRDVPPGEARLAGIRARALTQRGGILERLDDVPGARDAFALALDCFRSASPEHGGDRAQSAAGAYNLARLLRRENDTAGACALLAEALAWLDGLDDEDSDWPTPGMIRALVQGELGRTLQAVGDQAGSRHAYRAAIEEGVGLVARYPALPELRRDLGAARCNLAREHNERREFAPARDLLVAAVADLEQVLRETPGDDQASTFLGNARQGLCFCLRELGDWDALAAAARAWGSLPGGGPVPPRGAARHLLRCAEQSADAPHAASLREEAVLLLLESERRGWGNARLDDPLYAPLQGDERFTALRTRVEAKGR